MEPLTILRTGPLDVNTYIVPLAGDAVYVVDPAACALSGDETEIIDRLTERKNAARRRFDARTLRSYFGASGFKARVSRLPYRDPQSRCTFARRFLPFAADRSASPHGA